MLIRQTLTLLALPPALNLLMIVLGLLVALRYRRMGHVIALLGLVSLMAMSLPWVKMKIYEHLESYRALDLVALEHADPAPGAIVLLGGGMARFGDEFQRMRLTAGSIRRTLYAARVTEHSALPVLITGGGTSTETTDLEAELMGTLLRQLGHEPRWLETQSRTTWENALYSAPILKAAGIDTVVLVTDAWHMRRSVLSFEAHGIRVIPAPTAFRNGAYTDIRAFIPDGSALDEVADAIREWLGIFTYRILYADFFDRSKPISPNPNAISPNTGGSATEKVSSTSTWPPVWISEAKFSAT